MSKSKELRVLIDKTKKEIIKEIERIVHWNLDGSFIVETIREEDSIGMYNDIETYVKKVVMEELFHEYTLQNKK
tara:strand:+ start:1577 stop:1798 length:222 start_codon:yes stop_codon:yes gene_type:complete